MKMFRGLGQEHVARRLVLRGWPEAAAARMAEYMCDGREMPRWEELLGSDWPVQKIEPWCVEPCADCAGTGWIGHGMGGDTCGTCGGSGKFATYKAPARNPLVEQLHNSQSPIEPLKIEYTNHRGEHAVRNITPRHLWFGSTKWHPEPQWLLRAFDHDKGADRDFALSGFGKRT